MNRKKPQLSLCRLLHDIINWRIFQFLSTQLHLTSSHQKPKAISRTKLGNSTSYSHATSRPPLQHTLYVYTRMQATFRSQLHSRLHHYMFTLRLPVWMKGWFVPGCLKAGLRCKIASEEVCGNLHTVDDSRQAESAIHKPVSSLYFHTICIKYFTRRTNSLT